MAKQGAAQKQYDSIAGMLNFEKELGQLDKNLKRSEDLISQIDPTIIEASQQALKLLRGEDAGVTAPLKRQRETQRQRLLNSLREQLGPGAETSTAGIQALTRFDAETDSLFSNAQQNAIQGLGNTAGQFNAVRPDMFRDAMGKVQIGQGNANILNQAGQNVIDSAGAEFTEGTIRGQNNAAFGRSMLGFGASMLGSFMGGSGGGTPKPSGGDFGGFGSALLNNSAGNSYRNTSGVA
jgi:hypothetical protein